MPIKPHPTDPDKVVFVRHKLIPSYEEQAARIKVLERALIASEQDYEKLLKERGTTKPRLTQENTNG